METLGGKKQVIHEKRQVTGSDQIFMGALRYEVVKIADSSGAVGGRPLQFINTEWYTPEIRVSLAREFKESNGQSLIRIYDMISVIDDGKGK